MFHTLHRFVRLIFWTLVACLGVWLFQHRAMFNPLVDLVDALRIQDGFKQTGTTEVSGPVVKVHDGDTFLLKDEQGRALTIRLTGLDAPDFQRTNKTEWLLAGESKTNLSRLILYHRIRVHITYSNDTGGLLGLAYRGETNINAAVVASGMARLKREYLNGLPLKDRYALVRAERKANESIADQSRD